MTNTSTRTAEQVRYLYRWFDEHDELLYVGITTNPNQRAVSHQKNSWWFCWATRVEVEAPFIATLLDAEAIERAAIDAGRPVFNKRGAEDPFQRAATYLDRRGEDWGDYIDHFPAQGRPRLEHPRTYVLRIRLTETEREAVEAAAKEGGSVADWSREQLVKAAKRAARKADH